jgi:hypothetical protein
MSEEDKLVDFLPTQRRQSSAWPKATDFSGWKA